MIISTLLTISLNTMAAAPMQLTPQKAIEQILKSGIEKKRIEYKVRRAKLPYELSRSKFDTGIEISTAYEITQLESMNPFANVEDRNTSTGVRIGKNFSSGTYVELGYSRLDQVSILNANVNTRPDELSQSMMSLKVKQSLLQNAFGKVDRNRVKVAKSRLNQAGLASEEDLESLVLNSLQSYWNAYVGKQSLEEGIKARQLIGDLVKQVQKKAKVGFTGPGEVSRVLAEYEMQEQTVKNLSLNYISAVERLIVKMNLPSGTAVELQASYDLPPLPAKRKYEVQSNRYLKIANMQVKSADLLIENASSMSMPLLDVAFQMDSSGVDEDSGKAFSEMSSVTQPRYFLGLTLQFYIDSAAQDAEATDKKVALMDAQANLSWLNSQMNMEIETLYKRLLAENKVAKSAKKMVLLREKALRQMQKAYRQGRMDLDKLIQAHREVFGAKVALIRAVGNYRMSLNRFAASRDELVPPELIDNSGA